MRFSSIIKSYRKVFRLSQLDLVNILKFNNEKMFSKLSVISLHRWEAKKNKPDEGRLLAAIECLGLTKCVYCLDVTQSSLLDDYHNDFLPQYFMLNFCDENFSFLLLPVIKTPRIIFECQKSYFSINDPFVYYSTLIGFCNKNQSVIYFNNKTKYILGHIIFFVFDMSLFLGKIRYICLGSEGSITFNSKNIIENKQVLFICCGFSNVKTMFVHQFKLIGEELYKNIDIFYVFIRCYDSRLLHIIGRIVNYDVLIKNKQWSGILITSIDFKRLVTVFSVNEGGAVPEHCDIQACYDVK